MNAVRPLCFKISPGGALSGRLCLPGDKSISHRALILGAIADGETILHGLLQGADTLATARALGRLGVRIEHDGDQTQVRGVGLRGLSAADGPLDLGNSGTAMRLLAGLLSAQAFDAVLIGDESLLRRPMRRVIEPLRLMNAALAGAGDDTPPLTIRGGRRLAGIEYRLPVASAQLKSCLLLAGLYAAGETRLIEPRPTRDHTERLLAAFAQPLTRQATDLGNTLTLCPVGRLRASALRIPADFSAAAFFIVAATLAPGSDVVLENVGVNPTRHAMLEIMRGMGADIRLLNEREQSGEPVADIRVRHSALRGIDIPAALVPVAIDEFPAILVAAAAASGTTRLAGAAELRVKESDRIAAMLDGFRATGIEARETADGMIVTGGRFRGGAVASLGDHRIAMAFAVAGMVAEAPVTIHDCANVATSFPGFAELAATAGMRIETGG